MLKNSSMISRDRVNYLIHLKYLLTIYFISGTMIVAKNMMSQEKKQPDPVITIKKNAFLNFKEETQMFPKLRIFLKGMYQYSFG